MITASLSGNAATVLTLLCAVALIAAIFDVRSRRIPNWLSVAGILLGFSLNTLVYGTRGLVESLEGLVLAFCAYLGLHLLRAMGAGDVKLMAAIGAIAGPEAWFRIFLITAIIGAVLGLMVVVARRRTNQTAHNLLAMMQGFASLQAPYVLHPELDVRNRAALRLPHALSIGLGCLLYALFTLIHLHG